MRKAALAAGVGMVVFAAIAPRAGAVILYTDPTNPNLPARNTSPPAGSFPRQGWDYEGLWGGGSMGVPIAPQYFVTAEHVGGFVGLTLNYGGVDYTTTAFFDDPNSDLRIWKISGAFPSYSPLWTSAGAEATKPMYVFGRGTDRGALVSTTFNNQLHANGWMLGGSDSLPTWGQNVVTTAGTAPGSFVQWNFDSPTTGGVTNEGGLSFGDSSGGVFIQDASGIWRLAGINYGADLGPFSTSSTGTNPFNGIMFDKRGLYEQNNVGSWLSAGSGGSPVPSGMSASSIAANMSFINATIAVPTWNVDASGNWSTSTNWSGGIPSGVGVTANFGGKITTARTVTLDSPRTVGFLNFDNANRYTIAGTSTLTVSDAARGHINVVNGSHTISAPMSLQTSTDVQVAPGSSTLTLSGDVTAAAGVALNKIGAGTLEMKNIRVDQLNINAGNVRVLSNGTSAGTSRVATLSLAGSTNAWTTRLNLVDNDLIVDYGATSPRATMENQIKSGYANGSWNGNGITSSTAAANAASAHKTALGIAEASDFNIGSFSGQVVNSSSVLVRYTAAGDANVDGTVDLTDFTILAASFNGSGKRWAQGDFNYSGNVDLTDFTVLASNFNFSVATDPNATPSAVGTVVPEPASLSLLAGTFALSLRRRRVGA